MPRKNYPKEDAPRIKILQRERKQRKISSSSNVEKDTKLIAAAAILPRMAILKNTISPLNIIMAGEEPKPVGTVSIFPRTQSVSFPPCMKGTSRPYSFYGVMLQNRTKSLSLLQVSQRGQIISSAKETLSSRAPSPDKTSSMPEKRPSRK